MAFKVIAYGVLLSLVIVLINIAGDFIAIGVGPLISDATKTELFDLALNGLQVNHLLSRFLWNLPAGLVIAGITYWYFNGSAEQKSER